MKPANYLFVNNVRFCSMLAIIAIHSEFFAWNVQHNALNTMLLQLFKFGTPCFFIISGFLLGRRSSEVAPWQYYRKRLNSVMQPWLVWAGLMALALFVSHVNRPAGTPLGVAADSLLTTVFYTSFWFVPNFMLALALLLLFRRWHNALAFGGLLLTLSLIYGVNLYFGWLPTQHTTALLGFVFYLWLGMQLAAHHERVQGWIDRVPTALLLGLVVLTLGPALLEAWGLSARTPDFMSTLRLSNHFYALAVFALLMKFRRPISPRWMNVRASTFGLYLTHWLVMTAVFRVYGGVLERTYHLPHTAEGGAAMMEMLSTPQRLISWLALFVVVYGGAWLLTTLLLRTPLSWTVGQPRPNPPQPIRPTRTNAPLTTLSLTRHAEK